MTRDTVGQVLDIYDQMFALLRRLLAIAAGVEQRDARSRRPYPDQVPAAVAHARATPRSVLSHDPGD